MLETMAINKKSTQVGLLDNVIRNSPWGRSDSQFPFRIAISSQKGGVAKTTSCISLGASLVELGACVLLIDLDPQGHLTRAVGMNPEKMRHSSGDVLLNQATLLSVTRESYIPNMDILPSNPGLLIVDKLLYKTEAYEYRLKNAINIMQGNFYDYIILDCPPSFGPLTLNALACSDLAIIPVTCDYYSAQSLKGYLDVFDLVKRKNNPEVIFRVLITLFEPRTRISHLILEQYRNTYKNKVLNSRISLDVKIRESAVLGKPVTEYSKNSRGANEYRALARELVECQKVMF